MDEHFNRAAELRDAVVEARLDQAAEPARWLAGHAALPDLPDSWAPYLDSLRQAAARAADATDVPAAAVATAQVAEACGMCHSALGAHPASNIEGALPEGGDAAAHMRRHVWAAERLWEGMIVPSDKLWQSGAEVLTEVPLVPEEITADPSIRPQVQELETRVHELGAAAMKAGTPEKKTEIYGELLGTCGHCHGMLDVTVP
jgi:cytochrome c553